MGTLLHTVNKKIWWKSFYFLLEAEEVLILIVESDQSTGEGDDRRGSSKSKKAAQKEARMFYQPQKGGKPQSLDKMGRNSEEFSLPESPKVKQVESKRQLRRQPSEFEEVWDWVI